MLIKRSRVADLNQVYLDQWLYVLTKLLLNAVVKLLEFYFRIHGNAFVRRREERPSKLENLD